MTDTSALRPVALLGVPLELVRRGSEHGEALRRELAFVEHAADPTGAPVRLHLLGQDLAERYGSLTAAQAAELEQAVVAGAATIDLHYDLPAEVAEACDELEGLLDELDEFCREGDLLTLVTPPELLAYRRWFLHEVRDQLRDGRPPRPWAAVAGAADPADPPSAPARTGERDGDAARIVVEEDLDLALAPDLRDRIVAHTEAGVTTILVDLSRCPFMDSTGLSLLLTTHLRLQADGGRLQVEGARGQVAGLLQMSGLDALLAGAAG